MKRHLRAHKRTRLSFSFLFFFFSFFFLLHFAASLSLPSHFEISFCFLSTRLTSLLVPHTHYSHLQWLSFSLFLLLFFALFSPAGESMSKCSRPPCHCFILTRSTVSLCRSRFSNSVCLLFLPLVWQANRLNGRHIVQLKKLIFLKNPLSLLSHSLSLTSPLRFCSPSFILTFVFSLLLLSLFSFLLPLFSPPAAARPLVPTKMCLHSPNCFVYFVAFSLLKQSRNEWKKKRTETKRTKKRRQVDRKRKILLIDLHCISFLIQISLLIAVLFLQIFFHEFEYQCVLCLLLFSLLVVLRVFLLDSFKLSLSSLVFRAISSPLFFFSPCLLFLSQFNQSLDFQCEIQTTLRDGKLFADVTLSLSLPHSFLIYSCNAMTGYTMRRDRDSFYNI